MASAAQHEAQAVPAAAPEDVRSATDGADARHGMLASTSWRPYVEGRCDTELTARQIFDGCLAGQIPVCTRRLTKAQRSRIGPNQMYIFDIRTVRRWTDGRTWNSQSYWHFRNVSRYREMQVTPPASCDGPTADPGGHGDVALQPKLGGLTKKLFRGSGLHAHLRLVCYIVDTGDATPDPPAAATTATAVGATGVDRMAFAAAPADQLPHKLPTTRSATEPPLRHPVAIAQRAMRQYTQLATVAPTVPWDGGVLWTDPPSMRAPPPPSGVRPSHAGDFVQGPLWPLPMPVSIPMSMLPLPLPPPPGHGLAWPPGAPTFVMMKPTRNDSQLGGPMAAPALVMPASQSYYVLSYVPATVQHVQRPAVADGPNACIIASNDDDSEMMDGAQTLQRHRASAQQ